MYFNFRVRGEGGEERRKYNWADKIEHCVWLGISLTEEAGQGDAAVRQGYPHPAA